MRDQTEGALIGPSTEPPPFARSRASDERGIGALPTASWRPLIGQICTEWGVDPIRTEAHMLLESAGVDLAPNGAGATGLMQIVPHIWPELCEVVCRKHGAQNSPAAVRIPKINIEIGVRELKWWIEEHCNGNADGGSCAYFSGHCIPNGAADLFGTSDATYVEVIRKNMDRVRADGEAIPLAAFSQGDVIEVFDGPLRLRTGSSLSSAILASLPTGFKLLVTGVPIAQDGYSWYPVQEQVGIRTGWVAGQFCRLVH